MDNTSGQQSSKSISKDEIESYLKFIQAQFLLQNDQLADLVTDTLMDIHGGMEKPYKFRKSLFKAVRMKIISDGIFWSSAEEAEKEMNGAGFEQLYKSVEEAQNEMTSDPENQQLMSSQQNSIIEDLRSCLRDQ